MSSPTPDEYDPVFLHARREAAVIFVLWLLCLLWAVPYCYLNGYREPGDTAPIELVWGMPAWIVWGIAFPWLLANVATTVFCFCFFKEDPLGEDDEPEPQGP